MKNICIDPFEIKENFEADYLFLTHNHKDHTSLNDINKIIKSDTIVICPPICEESIKDIPNKKIFNCYSKIELSVNFQK